VNETTSTPGEEPLPAPGTDRSQRWQNLGGILKPDRVYVVLASLFGLAFLVLTPPFQVPDEDAHFYRSVEVSEGHLIARKEGNYTGDELPVAVKSLVDRFVTLGTIPEQKTTAREVLESGAVRDESDGREFVAFSNAAMHPPLAYLPQALGVRLARLVSSCVLAWFYAGRLFNLFAATAVTFFAIRLTPVGKWSFTALALTPMTLFEAASLSADALTNAVSFLLIAQVLACACSPGERAGSRDRARLALSGFAIGSTKLAYFLLPLCYVLIPVQVMGSRRRWWIGFGLFLAATFLAVLGWALVVRHIYSPADPREGMDPPGQILHMRSNPVEFLFALGRTTSYWRLLAEEYLGYLGLLDTRLPGWLLLAEFALLIVVFLGDYDPRAALTIRQAALAASVALVVGLTVLVIVHVTWDKPGAPNISVQGRYFIPIGPLIAIAIARFGRLIPSAVRKTFAAVPIAATAFIPVVLFLSLDRVFDRYFVDSPYAAAQRCYINARKVQKEGGSEAQVRELYEKALSHSPDHLKAHLQLGQMLQKQHPAEAAGHFRAVLRLDPRDIVALNNLATLLTRQLEFSEAVRLYREALAVYPNDEDVRGNLSRALRSQADLENAIRQVSLSFRGLLSADALEKRRGAGAQEAVYLKPNRGRVVEAAGRFSLLDPYFWRTPPPSGEDVPLADRDGRPPRGRRLPFYACCGVSAGPKRAFVFPPVEVVLLADDKVSWYFQVPLADLTPSEREQEQAYRRQHGIRFPLVSLPE
jgi:uncharacterized membrane protein